MSEFQGEKFITGREGGDYYSGFYVEWLEAKLEAMKRDRNYVVTWLYANINDSGLLKHFERARKLAAQKE